MNKKMTVIVMLMAISYPLVSSGVQLQVPNEYPSIQAAAEASIDGDEIIVADGTYTNIDSAIYLSGNVILRSRNGAEHTIIDGMGIRVSGKVTVIGFTISNTRETGISVEGESIVRNCIITNNSNAKSGYGGGVKLSGTNPVISDSLIIGNYAKYGGGIYSEAENAAINNCVIIDNYAEYDGGGIALLQGSAVISNSIIAGNYAEIGGGLQCSGIDIAKIVNCTITNNIAYQSGGGVNIENQSDAVFSHCIILNAIVEGNAVGQDGAQISINYGDFEFNNSSASLIASNVEGGRNEVYVGQKGSLNWLDGNIDSDPLFIDPDNGDYHLSSASRCRDAGLDIPVADFKFDLDGNTRILGRAIDIGAFEYQGSDSSATSSSPAVITSATVKTGKKGMAFTLKGLFTQSSIDQQDIIVRVGSFEEIILAGTMPLKGKAYTYRGSNGGITQAKFDASKMTFTITGKNINLLSLQSPVAIEVEIQTP